MTIAAQSRDDCKKICGYNQGRSYSDLFRVSMDLWRKPVGDKRRKDLEGDEKEESSWVTRLNEVIIKKLSLLESFLLLT